MAGKIIKGMNKYYSTNKDLVFGFSDEVSFKDALFMGMAPDKGLFMPTKIPRLSKKEILSLKGKKYHDVAFFILNRFLSGDLSDFVLKKITKKAYDFPVPIEKVGKDFFVVRLDRGLTRSFKDFGAGFLAGAMEALKSKGEEITILVATSGDTGSAIGRAFNGKEGIRVFILYPKDEVSTVQKKQLDSFSGNVFPVCIKGKFDDCQRLVKEAFSDPALNYLNLTSANSINIGRILAQVVYYFYSYVNVAEDFERVVFSVPSGNFGNSLGCEIARRMGLPVERIIIATNENDEFPRFLASGEYLKKEPSVACLSNAMNVGNPSNLARYFELYNGCVDKDGVVHKMPDLYEMRKNLYSVSVSDSDTVSAIRDFYDKYGKIIEPHGAVGFSAMKKYFMSNPKRKGILIETAAPEKFPEVVERVLNLKLKQLAFRKGKEKVLANDYSSFRRYLKWDG